MMATLSLYRGEIRLLSRAEVVEERRQLARRLLPIKIVAKGNAPHILEKTMGDTETFKLVLFLNGNGCEPNLGGNNDESRKEGKASRFRSQQYRPEKPSVVLL